jgi:hypothetical protein
MVHALETVHHFLVPGGVLIDIHPAGESPLVFLRTEAGSTLIGWLQESDCFVEYRQADRAIAQAVNTGLFRIAGHREFIFETHAPDIYSLADFLKTTWLDAMLEERIIERAAHLQQKAPAPARIVMAERIEIQKLVAQQVK